MNKIESIHVAPTTERKAEPGRFENALRTAASGLAQGVAATVELAAPYVPAGTVLSAAVRSAAQGPSSTVAAAASGGTAGSAATAAAGGSSTEGDVLEATRSLQQEARTFNLQYLQLQENMQRESREFTALSNVMKVKHDSAKSAISNIH
ncbi:MAG TPA: hypothetical protein VF894_05890 [Anaeromyxobacter sp.]